MGRQGIGRLFRHFPDIGMAGKREDPHRGPIIFDPPGGRHGGQQRAFLVDEPPDPAGAEQFRQLVPKLIQRGTVGQLFLRVPGEKPLFRRDLVIGENEGNGRRRFHKRLRL